MDLYPVYVSPDNAAAHAEALRDTDVAFSAWDMPAFTENNIRSYLPSLKAVFCAAGSVRHFARPFLRAGVTVVSAWAAGAAAAAEWTAAQIVLADKGFYQTVRNSRFHCGDTAHNPFPSPALTRANGMIGLLGAGAIGKHVIELLKPYNMTICVHDPSLSDESARQLGVLKMDLHGIFASCRTISNHSAARPETIGVLNAEHFGRMLPNATFIHSGRGAQIAPDDLAAALRAGPARTAVLDAVHPGLLGQASELLGLDNVIMTPDEAASDNMDIKLLSGQILDEFRRFERGEPLRYAISLHMLEPMA